MPTSRDPEARRSRARDEFVDAAYRVIDSGGPNPSMNDIAREAGATKPRLYRQFADKADLYSAVAQRMADEVYTLAVSDFNFLLDAPVSALRHAITGYAEVVGRHPNVFRFLAQSRTTPEDSAAAPPLDIGRDIATRFSTVAETILKSVDADTTGIDYACRAAVGAVLAATDLWLDDQELEAAEFVDQLSALVWGLLDAFLRRKEIDLDGDEPIFVALARLKG
ncbi:MAG: TetR/AcrR family transcriptional regulator [Rhodococcus sp. (in: high G+C Gram-positive bacteria)]|jgi:AcrR family transcriptional regulator|uniref:TetR/AcrR family transcriptional regulator n=1 Tax=Rhodococcus sp. EPR-157 TaxID=1813677 RepID=UPI0007BB5BAC|nr:TetR/AcrR family transcriptional regulator [Rhodococcus sp. EPR-157]KZF09869.1 TetR family transcriptional regulator [Rhodococcus sp. EPR-157]